MTMPLDPATTLGSAGTTGTAHFGHGGDRPYEAALTHGWPLLLRRVIGTGGSRHDVGEPDQPVDVARFLADPDPVDRFVIRRTTGPVLDVGCGPGRMVAEAVRRGRIALGIDVSPTAVDLARRVGRAVILRSVFDSLPGEGAWGTVLLLDGNIGIGGDPTVLLARCAALIAPDGTLVVEAHPDANRHARFDAQLVDGSGVSSGAFPWAQTGARVVAELAAALGLEVARTLTRGGRQFVFVGRSR